MSYSEAGKYYDKEGLLRKLEQGELTEDELTKIFGDIKGANLLIYDAMQKEKEEYGKSQGEIIKINGLIQTNTLQTVEATKKMYEITEKQFQYNMAIEKIKTFNNKEAALNFINTINQEGGQFTKLDEEAKNLLREMVNGTKATADALKD